MERIPMSQMKLRVESRPKRKTWDEGVRRARVSPRKRETSEVKR